MYSLFNDCYYLTTLDLSGWNMNKKVRTVMMFSGCNSLKTIYLRGCPKATVKKIVKALEWTGIDKQVELIY